MSLILIYYNFELVIYFFDKIHLKQSTLKAAPIKTAKLGAKKSSKKGAFGGVKKVSSSAFKASAAAAEREEKEIKVKLWKSFF